MSERDKFPFICRPLVDKYGRTLGRALVSTEDVAAANEEKKKQKMAKKNATLKFLIKATEEKQTWKILRILDRSADLAEAKARVLGLLPDNACEGSFLCE